MKSEHFNISIGNNGLTKTQNDVKQNNYQLLTKNQKIKLNNVINKKQFQSLIHDGKKNKQKMIGTIQKQKE